MEAILNAPCRVQNFEGEVMEWARAGTCGCERFRVEKNGRLLGRGAGVIELRGAQENLRATCGHLRTPVACNLRT